jgi:hypothetical protein
VACRLGNDLLAQRIEQGVCAHDERTRALGNKLAEFGFDIGGARRFEHKQAHTERARRSRQILVCEVGGVQEKRDGVGGGHDLVQHLQPLGCDFGRKRPDTSEIAAGPAEARHQAEFDRIVAGQKHDGDALRRGLGGERSGCRAHGDDDGHLPAHEVGEKRWQRIVAAVRPTVFDRGVAAFDEACLGEALSKARELLGPRGGRRGTVQEPDDRHRRLLRPRHHRPRRRAPEPRDERPPIHSITSSART